MPVGSGWSFEAKWDGLRAIVSTVDSLTVRSRRGWHMEARVPELEALPRGLVLDGELVAFRGGDPWFPYVGDRILHGRDVPAVLIIFDLLHCNGESLLRQPYTERRGRLDALDLNAEVWRTSPVFDHGEGAHGDGRGARLGRRRGEESRGYVPARAARLDQGEEPRLLALCAGPQLASRFRSRSPFLAESF